MKIWFCILTALFCCWSRCGHCDASAEVRVLFIFQKMPRLASYQKALLSELQLTGNYHWIQKDLAFADASLPSRFEQLRPVGEELQCDTAVWIDEVSPHKALVQVWAMAPGRMAMRSIEVNLKTQTAADTAIVIDELLAQTDVALATPKEEGEGSAEKSNGADESIESIASSSSKRSHSKQSEKKTPAKPVFALLVTGEADVASYEPVALLPGGGVEGCAEWSHGAGSCVSILLSGKRGWRVTDVDVSQIQFRPGLAVYFNRRVSHFAFGVRLDVRPVYQRVKIDPTGHAVEQGSYANGNAALGGLGRLFLGRHLVLQLRIGAKLWFRTLTFTRQSTGGTLFETPRLSPLAAISIGTIF